MSVARRSRTTSQSSHISAAPRSPDCRSASAHARSRPARLRRGSRAAPQDPCPRQNGGALLRNGSRAAPRPARHGTPRRGTSPGRDWTGRDDAATGRRLGRHAVGGFCGKGPSAGRGRRRSGPERTERAARAEAAPHR